MNDKNLLRFVPLPLRLLTSKHCINTGWTDAWISRRMTTVDFEFQYYCNRYRAGLSIEGGFDVQLP